MNTQTDTKQYHTYKVGNINFIVTPVYPSGKNKTIIEILLELMKEDVEQK